MSSLVKLLGGIPISPVLLALFAVLALLANNIDQISGDQAVRSLIFAAVGATILIGLSRIALGNWAVAGIAAFVVVLLFFSYGHVYTSLKRTEILSVLAGRHRYLIPLWIAILVISLYGVRIRITNPAPISAILNLATVILLIMPLSTVLIFLLRTQPIQNLSRTQSAGDCELRIPLETMPPDIYYFILDAYARSDVMEKFYEFDNASFISGLSNMGFFVAPWSQGNYTSTQFSLTSSLNMDYLQSLDERIYDGAPYDVATLWPLLGNNQVRRNLECLGYQIVAFDSGYHALGWRNADVYLSPISTSFADTIELSRGINAFESMLIQSTAGLVMTDVATIAPRFLEVDTSNPFNEHRTKVLYQLDALEQIVPNIQGPKFVFAHILVTHKPYVFGPNGEPLESDGFFTLAAIDEGTTEDQNKSRYVDQVKYLNARLESAIGEIIKASDTPPVIILQSDHGAILGPRMNIFNAYYLPNGGDSLLYETISPVNSFRIVFNSYLSGNYEILEDVSYSSTYESFDFEVVANEHAID